MKKMLHRRETAPQPLTYSSFPREMVSPVTDVEGTDRNPRAFIRGDISFCVTEREVMLGPSIGHYRVEAKGMQEPLFFLWHAQNGIVLHPHAGSTDIAFDLRGERTNPWWTPVTLEGGARGQLWTSVISVQVTSVDARVSLISGTFVQILVTEEDVLKNLA